MREYAYRPKGYFVQLPREVVNFILHSRPATIGKLYLYLYDISISQSSSITPVVSYRTIADVLSLKKSMVENAVNILKDLGAIDMYEISRARGTRYKIKLPEYISGSLYFVSMERCSYMFTKFNDKTLNYKKQESMFD
jgi:hypothetical protein